jgi:carbonic anhydrase
MAKGHISLTLLILILTFHVSDAWDYQEGGDDWGGVCSTGRKQSPINLADSVVTKTSGDQSILKATFDLVGEFKGSCILTSEGVFMMNYNYGSIQINSNLVTLGNIHFHSPSEHKINGKALDLELHLTGDDEDSVRYEIVFLFEVSSKSNKFIQATMDSYNNNKEEDFNTEWLISNGVLDNYYYYEGSFSGPIFGDCDENIYWLVVGDIIDITDGQLDFFSNFWKNNNSFSNGHGNNRNTQNINGRTVYYYLDDESSSNGYIVRFSLSLIFAVLV